MTLHKEIRERLETKSFEKLRHEILRRDGWRCQACGKMSNLDVHHKQYLSQAGNDCDENLITLCRACHVITHGVR
jgi:5-methylcytosine-specific restriction protein A